MRYENLIVEREGGVGLVTVNRPKVMNALSIATMRELAEGVTSFREKRRPEWKGR